MSRSQIDFSLLQGFNPNMSERVQLLLSDRILGMTLVPEGRVWNYGIGLTQLWTPSLSYSVTLDTPLLFWAEEHRPAAFLSVSQHFQVNVRLALTFIFYSLPISRLEMIAQMWIITSLSFFVVDHNSILYRTVLLSCICKVFFCNFSL